MDSNFSIICPKTVTRKDLEEMVNFARDQMSASDEKGSNHIEFAVLDGTSDCIDLAYTVVLGGFCGSLPDFAIADIIELLDRGHIDESGLEETVSAAAIEYNSTVAPFTFAPQTSLEQVHGCFITLRLSTAWVTRNGKVLGKQLLFLYPHT
jgi:hypothetical protein